MPAAGGTEVRIAPSPGQEKLFGWTAAGNLLFLSDRTGRNGLYLVRLNNGSQVGEPEEVRSNLPELRPVGLTPGGTLFYSEPVRVGNVMSATFDVASGKAESAAAPLAARYPNPTEAAAWTSDGRYVAVQRLTADPDRTTFLIMTPTPAPAAKSPPRSAGTCAPGSRGRLTASH